MLLNWRCRLLAVIHSRQATAPVFHVTAVGGSARAFRAPTLRSVGATAPYMHDGSIATLEEVIDHYRNGGRNVTEGPHAGDGARNPFKSVFVREFEITDDEKADVLAFLGALTDEAVIRDPALSDPFAAEN